jgi:ribosomal 50S subunit-recycling heat shock protein
MPSAPASTSSPRRFPERTFDVGIAEQHAVTFAAGLAARATSRSARSIRPSCSAPTTRSCTTSRSRTCRCASRSTAPGWSAPTGRPMPALRRRLSRTACRTSWSWPRPTRPSWCTWWHTMARTTAARSRFRYPRGEGGASACPQVPQPLEIGKGRIVREGSKVAILSLGTRSRKPEGGRPARGQGAFRPPSPTLRFAKPLDGAEDPDDAPARPLHRPGQARRSSMTMRGSMLRISSNGAKRQEQRRHRGGPGVVRADQLLVSRGLAESRTRAQALIMAGAVFSGEKKLAKPGDMLAEDAPLEVRGKDPSLGVARRDQARTRARPFRLRRQRGRSRSM